MKNLMFMIVFFSWNVYAESAKVKKDVEGADNIKSLFLDTLDPASILKDSTPKFVELNEIEHLTDKEDFETMGALYSEKTSTITVPGFLYSEKIKPLATVSGGFSGEEMLAPLSRVLLKIEGNIEKDKIYSILRLGRVAKSSGSKWSHYTYGGDITITEILSKKQAVGMTDSLTIAKAGDILIPVIDSQRKIDTSLGIRRPFKGRATIMSLVEENAKVVGEAGFVFLDKGLKDGLEMNQQLDVHLDKEVHKLKGENSQIIGTLQIIDLTPTSATAYVVKASREITLGDYAL